MRTQAAWDLEKRTLILFSLNLSSQPRIMAWNIASPKTLFADNAKVESLSAPTARVFVTETAANPIIRETAELRTDGRSVVLTAKPYSATAIRLSVTK